MLPTLRFFSFLLLCLSLGFARPAQASHAVGGSITYTALGGNSYRVRLDCFRDCSSLSFPPAFTLNCQTACNSTAVTAVLSQVGQPFVGTPYNSAVQPLAVCPIGMSGPAGTPPNFAAYRYEGTVTLPASQWTLSVEEASRTLSTNLTASSLNVLRLEATLDNRTVANTSVVFSNLPIFFIPSMQANLLHIGAFDADGDSLSYALARPLNGCNTYETYTAFPVAQCQAAVLSTSPPCMLACSANPSSFYTAKLPISVALDTLGTCPNKYSSPRFAFDSLTGALRFMPNRYVNTGFGFGDNKSAVTMKVTEWRKVNGTYVAVGTTRRDMLWVVYDGSTAVLPRLAQSVTVRTGSQSSTQPLGLPIVALKGQPVAVEFLATSPRGLPLAFTLEQNTVPGAVIQPSAAAIVGRLLFTPPLTLRDGTYNVSLTVTDDAAPLRDIITVPVTFRVVSTVLAARTAALPTIFAFPTPFAERVQFQLAKAGVQSLTIHDQLGRLVARVASQASGLVQWQPGAEVPAGLYLARTADGSQTVRLLRSGAE